MKDTVYKYYSEPVIKRKSTKIFANWNLQSSHEYHPYTINGIWIWNLLTSYPKETAITVISKPKKNSSFRRPYLSSNKKVKVSKMVIKTPIHKGILEKQLEINIFGCFTSVIGRRLAYSLFDKRYKAIAVPITSCISEPMMAISIINQTNIRGNSLYCR